MAMIICVCFRAFITLHIVCYKPQLISVVEFLVLEATNYSSIPVTRKGLVLSAHQT